LGGHHLFLAEEKHRENHRSVNKADGFFHPENDPNLASKRTQAEDFCLKIGYANNINPILRKY